MIDLNDERQKYYYLNKCISNKTIDFYGEKIYQPIVDDIFDIGEEEYTKLLIPFIVTNEFLKKPTNIDLFDVFMMDEDKSYSYLLLNSLCYFFKITYENIKVYESKDRTIKDKTINKVKLKLRINDKLTIDSEKFQELRILIQMMCNTKELTKEDVEDEETKFVDEESRRKVEQFLKEKKEIQGKNPTSDKRIKLANVYDYVVHGQENINYDIPLKWSIYQLYNSYQNLHKKENVHFIYDVASNGMLDKKEKIKSLSEELAK